MQQTEAQVGQRSSGRHGSDKGRMTSKSDYSASELLVRQVGWLVADGVRIFTWFRSSCACLSLSSLAFFAIIISLRVWLLTGIPRRLRHVFGSTRLLSTHQHKSKLNSSPLRQVLYVYSEAKNTGANC